MLKLRAIIFLVALLALSSFRSDAQTEDVAQHVYRISQDSIFLVYLNDSTGSPTALGTAFLVAPRLLITNAHVANAGSPVLAVGPVRIPLTVVRTDEQNDLAILSVGVDLTSKPLPLAKEEPSPGQQVFAIGNPEGLEKTISQGIVAGLRQNNARKLIQITSPISHGSSGGPILNASGEVVGVAVGMIEDGQNLNFAIPVSYVRQILASKSEIPAASTDFTSEVEKAFQLLKKRSDESYSDDPNSPYNKDGEQILALVKHVEAGSDRAPDLEAIACMSSSDSLLSDSGIAAARKLVQKSPSLANRELLTYTLYLRMTFEGYAAAFAKEGSNEKNEAKAAQDRYESEALREGSAILSQERNKTHPTADFVVANIKENQSNYGEAIDLFSRVVANPAKECGDDLTKSSYSQLVYSSASSSRPDDAERWFKRYASVYQPSFYEWDAEGDRRDAAHDFKGAADSYERAAADSSYDYDYCYAAVENYLANPTNADGVLKDGRSCVDASVRDTSQDNQRHFKGQLPSVYKYMATVLQSRGVDQPALEYIKESLAAKPDDPFSLSKEGDIFEDLQRYSECISAYQSAISVSDGKYPWMNFQLGNCYFDTENWSMAAAAFRRSAEADKTDAASAFNEGLSLARQGYGADAREWFNEALRRKPDDDLKIKIVSALK